MFAHTCRWLRKAAQAGNAEAMNWLGELHDSGEGVEVGALEEQSHAYVQMYMCARAHTHVQMHAREQNPPAYMLTCKG